MDTIATQAALDALNALDAPIAAAKAALSAALAPPVVVDPPVVTAPPPAMKRLLTPGDFAYLGMFTLPTDVAAGDQPAVRLGYSAGRVAGRYVDGQLRLALTQSNASGWTEPVCEISVPDTFGPDLKTAPRATLLQNFGDIYGGQRLLYQPYKTMTGGLAWVTAADGQPWLAWSYYDYYNVSAIWNPSIGATRFSPDGTLTTIGPWRTSVPSHQTCGFFVPIPADMRALFGGRSLAIGSPQTAGDALSPWGASLFGLPALDPSRPPDPIGPTSENDTLPKSLSVQVGLLQDYSHPLQNAQYQNCAWNVLYDASQGATLKPPAAGDEGGRMQTFGGCVWIDDADKQGLLYVGQAPWPHPDNASDPAQWPHAWYGPSPCPHGRVDPHSQDKGNHADQIMPLWAIYDQADVAAVIAGTKKPYEPQPASLTNMMAVYGAQGLTGQTGVPAGYGDYHGGVWFDETTRRLYVTCTYEDRTNVYSPRPVVRVFQVK